VAQASCLFRGVVTNMKRAVVLILLLLLIIALLVTLLPAVLGSPPDAPKPHKYDDDRLGEKKDQSDRFKFVRVLNGPMYSGQWLGDRGVEWSHDYPEAGVHFSKILAELSKLNVALDDDEYIFSFADPNLFKYPFAYTCEVGHMMLSDEEVAGLREYVLRGGFLLVDDFRGPPELQNFQSYVKRALPEYEMKPLDLTHPIFNCFFSIKTLDVRPVYTYRGGGGLQPQFFGIEDKHGRLMMIINYNYDVSDFWQWSNDPFQPIEDTNSAYKFGVNYVFYALTH
jgi:hypothetical protein